MSYTDRFETINDLYYRRYHCLRPGKDEAPQSYRDSSSEENHAQFENWIATRAFTDAIDRITQLEKELEALRG